MWGVGSSTEVQVMKSIGFADLSDVGSRRERCLLPFLASSLIWGGSSVAKFKNRPNERGTHGNICG